LKLSKPQYVIGIDLGTTNSGAAYAEIRPDADPFAPANVQLFPVQQLTNPGEVREEDLLPSFMYLPGSSDFAAGSIALPWDESRAFVVGRLAQKRGAENAGRLISSAKSWLSHSAVDRTSPLLPFRAPDGVEKISPVEASRRYLEHLREAWDAKMPDATFTEQQVLVTVPAFNWLWTSHDELNHHVGRYTANQVRDLMNEAGLTAIETSYLFQSLLLPKLLVRAKEALTASAARVPQVPARAVNIALQAWYRSEYRFAGGLPFGSSVLAIAQRS